MGDDGREFVERDGHRIEINRRPEPQERHAWPVIQTAVHVVMYPHSDLPDIGVTFRPTPGDEPDQQGWLPVLLMTLGQAETLASQLSTMIAEARDRYPG